MKCAVCSVQCAVCSVQCAVPRVYGDEVPHRLGQFQASSQNISDYHTSGPWWQGSAECSVGGPNIAVPCSVVKCSSVQCSTMQCSAVQFSAVQYQFTKGLGTLSSEQPDRPCPYDEDLGERKVML